MIHRLGPKFEVKLLNIGCSIYDKESDICVTYTRSEKRKEELSLIDGRGEVIDRMKESKREKDVRERR